MPRISADALASADVMDIVRQTALTHHNLFESNHLRTDFVMVVLYALVRQSLERLEETIADTPALRQIFDQSSLPWKCRHGATATSKVRVALHFQAAVASGRTLRFNHFPISASATSRSYCVSSPSQNWGELPKKRARRRAVSAVTLRLPSTIALIRRASMPVLIA